MHQRRYYSGLFDVQWEVIPTTGRYELLTCLLSHKQELNPPSWQSLKNGFSEQQMPSAPFPPCRDFLTGASSPKSTGAGHWFILLNPSSCPFPMPPSQALPSGEAPANAATPGWSLFSPSQILPKVNTDPKCAQTRTVASLCCCYWTDSSKLCPRFKEIPGFLFSVPAEVVCWAPRITLAFWMSLLLRSNRLPEDNLLFPGGWRGLGFGCRQGRREAQEGRHTSALKPSWILMGPAQKKLQH